MNYKCIVCKTLKSFVNPAPREAAFCKTCRRSCLFVPENVSTIARMRKVAAMALIEVADHLRDEERSSIPRPVPPARASAASSSRTPSIRPCDYFKLCLEFLLTLDCTKALFNRQHNRCYCQHCYPTSRRDSYVEGGMKYVIPRGWVRFGLYVDKAQEQAEQIWKNWAVSYHGTNPEAAKSIIEHHQFLVPGDQSITGRVIKIEDGHIPGKFHIYTSPTIAYSGNDIYSRSTAFRSRVTGKSYHAKVVLQCRQKPGTFTIQPETIGATDRNRRICPIIPNDEVEYFTEARASVIPCGFLIRIFE